MALCLKNPPPPSSTLHTKKAERGKGKRLKSDLGIRTGENISEKLKKVVITKGLFKKNTFLLDIAASGTKGIRFSPKGTLI